MLKMFCNVNEPLGITFDESPWDNDSRTDIEDGSDDGNTNITDNISTENETEFDSINNYADNIIKETNYLYEVVYLEILQVYNTGVNTAQKIKFSMKDFFSKYD